MATAADVRVLTGTTHERPMDRFERERVALVPAPQALRLIVLYNQGWGNSSMTAGGAS